MTTFIQKSVAHAIREGQEGAAEEVNDILGHYITDNRRLNLFYQAVAAVEGAPGQLATVCSWCQSEVGEKSGPGVSHGICQRHADELEKEAGL